MPSIICIVKEQLLHMLCNEQGLIKNVDTLCSLDDACLGSYIVYEIDYPLVLANMKV